MSTRARHSKSSKNTPHTSTLRIAKLVWVGYTPTSHCAISGSSSANPFGPLVFLPTSTRCYIHSHPDAAAATLSFLDTGTTSTSTSTSTGFQLFT